MEKTKRLQYSENNMEAAISAVKGGMPIAKASSMFSVPRTTLSDKVKGKVPLKRKIGPATILTSEEETLLVKWLLHIGDCGFPATKLQLLDSEHLLLKNLQRPNPFTGGRPGRHWYESFLKRHPELSTRVSQNLTSSRANVTEAKIRQWFREILDYLISTDSLNIISNPSRVYNCDETAFYLSPKENKVLVRKGDKAVYNFISNDEKECLTTLVTCSASGEFPPPMIVYSYKRIPRNIVENVPETWGVARSDNGWMTGETFFEFIANIFHPWLLSNNIELPVILFLDGHSSHLTMALSEFCSEHKIILIALYPNSTHILQPLDVAVFRPLKLEWKKSVHSWRMVNNGKKLGREDFPRILDVALKKMKKLPDIVKNGFRTCGLVPFNPDNINFSKYFENNELVSQINEGQDLSQHELTEVLKFLEKDIPNKIELFLSTGETWQGDIEDTSLYNFWKSIKDRVMLIHEDHPTSHVTADEPNTFPEENQVNSSIYSDTIDITDIINAKVHLPINRPKQLEIINVSDCSLLEEEEYYNGNVIIHVPFNGIKAKEIDGVQSVNANGQNESQVEDQRRRKPVLPMTSEKESSCARISVVANDGEKLDNTSNLAVTVTENDNFSQLIQYPEFPNITNDGDKLDKRANLPVTVTENDHLSQIIQSPERSNLTPNEDKTDNPPIPSPFKKSLFWPTPKTSVPKRKIREKIPAVATSQQWQSYFKKKEEQKNNEIEKKEKNKKERKRKLAEKKQKLQEKRVKKHKWSSK